MVLSGVGVAAITGHLPGSEAAKAPEAAAVVKPCLECGVVLRVKEVKVKGKGDGRDATTKRYHTEVRMTDGTMKTVTSAAQPSWKSGDAVRLQNGKLIAQEPPRKTG